MKFQLKHVIRILTLTLKITKLHCLPTINNSKIIKTVLYLKQKAKYEIKPTLC